jgi:hypothetical protein
MAIKLKGTSCHWPLTDRKVAEITLANDIICGGINTKYDFPGSCYYGRMGDEDALKKRCRSSKADSTFLLLTAVTLMSVGAMTYLRMKKGY